jgi:D-3-phosphoglycerate dehydrogenase
VSPRAYNVLVTDHSWPDVEIERAILGAAGAIIVEPTTLDEMELTELARNADAIITCFRQVSAAAVRASRDLQTVARYGIGVDNIAVEEASKRDVIVSNVPDYCTHEVAEHTIALLLALVRNITQYNSDVRAGKWELKAARALHRLAGQTAGIIGYGRVGRSVATKMAALGLEVLALDRGGHDHAATPSAPERVTLPELLRRSDVVTIHVPLSDGTRSLIGDAELKLMKSTALLINTARGAVVEQAALVRALEHGWIAGAGLDVFEPERLEPDHPLLGFPNVIATPHVAFYSEESLQTLARSAATNVALVLQGHLPLSIVNPSVLASSRWSHLTRLDGRTPQRA